MWKSIQSAPIDRLVLLYDEKLKSYKHGKRHQAGEWLGEDGAALSSQKFYPTHYVELAMHTLIKSDLIIAIRIFHDEIVITYGGKPYKNQLITCARGTAHKRASEILANGFYVEDKTPVKDIDGWYPIASAPDNKLVLVKGKSGYSTHKTYCMSAYRDPSYRLNTNCRWYDVTGTDLSDSVGVPTHWRELPPGAE